MKRLNIFIMGIGAIIATILVISFASCSKQHHTYYANASMTVNHTLVSKLKIIGHWFGEGKREKLLRSFLRSYEFENQHLLIEMKFPHEFFNYSISKDENHIRLISSEMNKAKPDWDILILNNLYKPMADFTNNPLWAKEHLVDFSLIPEFRNRTLPHLLTNKTKSKYGGIIPGPFLEGSYWALWANKEVTDRLGISVKEKGMTFNDFISYMRIVNEHNNKNPYDKVVPIFETGDWRTLFVLAFQLYASALNNNAELLSNNISEQKLMAWHKTLMALEELSKFNPLADGWEYMAWDDHKNDVMKGQCLFMINGSWMYNTWENESSVNVANAIPIELPVFNNIASYPASYDITWCVLKNSPNKDEAVELLLAMTDPKVAERWVQCTKCPTGIKSRLTGQSFGLDRFENFSDYIQSNYKDDVYNYGEDFSKYIINDADINKTFYLEVLSGNISADGAMENIRKNLEAINP